MASRKFKEEWAPTPLPVPPEVEAKTKARELPRPLTVLARFFVVTGYFLVMMFRLAAVRLWPSLGRGRYSPRENGRYTREFVERMGGMWVIMARMASLRVDLLGDAFCEEFTKTRDRAVPLPMDVVRQVIDEELRKRGTSIDLVLEDIDEYPLNTRAFCQFHLARLKDDGRQVVLRVRPPDAPQRAKIDWAYMCFLFGLLDRLGIAPHLRWKNLMFEVKKATDDQLDYRTEESEVRRTRKILRRRRIYVPRIYRQYTGERLLISEYISGVSVADFARALRNDQEQVDLWMQQNGVDRRRLCRRLFSAHLELLFEHNLFYTELLPRNILILRGNRLALVTLNTIGTLEASILRKYRILYQSLVAKDYTKVSETFLTMGPPLPRKDLSAMRLGVTRSLKVWESRTYIKAAPYAEKSLSAAMQRLSVCAGRCNLPASWDLTRLNFAERTLDLALETLDQGLSFMKVLRRYDRAAQIRTIEQGLTKDAPQRLRNLSDVAQVGMRLAENFEFDNDYLRRRMIGFRGTIGRAGAIGKRIVTMLFRVAVAVIALEGFIYLKKRYQLPMGPDEGVLGDTIEEVSLHNRWAWLIALLVVLYVLRILYRLNKQLSKEEIRPVGSR